MAAVSSAARITLFRTWVSRLAIAVALGAALPAVGQDASTDRPPEDRWTFLVAPYLWAISLDGDARVKGVDADVDVPFSDALKDFSFGGMLLVDARRGRFGIGANGVFTRTSPDADVGPLEIDATTDLAQVGIGPYYRALEWQYGESASGRPLRLVLEPWVGGRLNHLRVELEVRGGQQFDDNQTWVDPVIGTRFAVDLTDHFVIAGEADVGGVVAGSDLSWKRPGLPRLPHERARPTDHLHDRLPRAVRRLRPQRLQVGRHPARPDPRRGAALLSIPARLPEVRRAFWGISQFEGEYGSVNPHAASWGDPSLALAQGTSDEDLAKQLANPVASLPWRAGSLCHDRHTAPHARFRCFDLTADDLDRSDFAKHGYDNGVPMGAISPARPRASPRR